MPSCFFPWSSITLLGQWLRRNRNSIAPLGRDRVSICCCSAAFKYIPEVSVPPSILFTPGLLSSRLPLGISFWTFQALSYLFDLYRGEELDPTFPSLRCTWRFSRSRSPGPSAACRTCCRNSALSEPHRGSDIGEGFRRIAIGVFMMQLAKTAGPGNSGRRQHYQRIRPHHTLERAAMSGVSPSAMGCSCSLISPDTPTSRLAPRTRWASGCRKISSGPLPPPVLRLLDALAHVALVLDSRLRLSPAGHDAPRNLVAQRSR